MARLRAIATREDGFTLVELLVVVLCIGILAAIAIPSFLSQREKAMDGGAKSEARTAQTAAETYFINEQTYLTLNTGALRNVENSLNNANITAASGTVNTFVITVRSKSNNTFTITRAGNGLVTRTCGTAGKGACAKNGSW